MNRYDKSCDHVIGVEDDGDNVRLSYDRIPDRDFKHCPECGEKMSGDHDARFLRGVIELVRLGEGFTWSVQKRLNMIAERLEAEKDEAL